jgi:hypothetical protein
VNGVGNGNCAVIHLGTVLRAAPPPRSTAATRSAAVEAPREAPPGDRIVRHTEAGAWIALKTSPEAEARIAAGLHQRRVVDGAALDYPSQDLQAIESARPFQHGQTHSLTEHVGTDLAANVRRLTADRHIRAAGSYTTEPLAQLATDRTIANPANQRAIGAFLADPGRLKVALDRVDAGTVIGTTTTRAGLDAGRPTLIAGRTATVVLIKDASFPEGYRVLTTYPDTRPPEVDARGNRLS